MEKEQLVLASESPRRKELLENSRINFTIATHDFDEEAHNESDPVKFAMDLAYGKALSVAEKKGFSCRYILGVDTVVVFNNEIFGKPLTKEDAEKTVRILENRTHDVISGIALVNKDENIKIIKNSITKVEFGSIDTDFMKFYLDNYHWKGYAGGYAIQGIFGLIVKKISGSYSNVVGLPLETLYDMLKKINKNFFI